ncbi:MAG: metallophosphoesterase [Candidatus Aegiribacteria sp.]|nr:metallophosphoesterase [Candidatus Aegiribacteria sp.]
MAHCLFCSDLHGRVHRYEELFRVIREEEPDAVFLGGDLLPGAVHVFASDFLNEDFINDFLAKELLHIKENSVKPYPEIFLILGNDDGRFEEATMIEAARTGLWHYVHNRKIGMGSHQVYGYSYVPPTPFRLKDWEKYDVSRYVDPGCIHPEDGIHTVPVSDYEMRYSTIKDDLELLTDGDDLSQAIMLFHSPPYRTNLDRAALDGRMIDHAPLDVHVGSIAIQKFIKKRQPLITLHGHIHESCGITGKWMDSIGETTMFSAAHDGPELALVRFDPDNPESASRELL